ncbi:MAG: Type I Iterative PKS [Peltula sp. TS41687]|nr:MAG: Type I Iterative PKS [Peltula sp. TS41687]
MIDDSGLDAKERPTSARRGSIPRSKAQYLQDPIAVVGFACRLPGDCNTPKALWDFLERGGCADTTPPDSRFRLKAHHDGSRKPKTMACPGGMFLENIDPRHFDASFFKLSKQEAISMDPQQRQLLEVVYEGLENAGIPLKALDGRRFGCFAASYASDYGDIQSRDPDDRAPATSIGLARTMLSNRVSHFLNITGPSMTLDTACSGGLVSIDVAARYLHTREIDGAIVAASNLYFSPEHTTDHFAMSGAHSPSGRCHTFDAKADGYVKGEAVNMVVLKRLDDALRDGDPIRAVIRGSATNSDGWTAGIASPKPDAQAAAVRRAYANANLSDFSATSYLECHGTGTKAGDPIEVAAAASVFCATRSVNQPLLIGSIKSNMGHSECAAGLSGLLKVTLAFEKGLIPGNPTFVTPSPAIDFDGLKVHASRATSPWPDVPFRRASVNSFGFGGSNAHIILDEANAFLNQAARRHVSSYVSAGDDLFADEDDNESSVRPRTLVFSANDEQSLRSYYDAMGRHLANLDVSVRLRDLAFTLSERRSQHFFRGYVVARSCDLEGEFVLGKARPDPPRIGFVFTGQGAQWSEMGKGFVATFPAAKPLLKRLDEVLLSLPDPPSWSLLGELVEPRTPEHLRLPEFSQPLVTALQLVILAIFNDWGVRCQSVVGHSSGEIAAAVVAGYLTPEEAIKVAYYRGKAASDRQDGSETAVGMLAVGIGSEAIKPYLSNVNSVEIGCVNSPDSVTLSGELARLEELKNLLQRDGHFARLLQVDLAYHSRFMAEIAMHYENLLVQHCGPPSAARKDVSMFSSVTGGQLDDVCDARYWRTNMVSPVLFSQAVQAMICEPAGADFLIEIGPSGALAGPITQIKKSVSGKGACLEYVSASKRGPDAVDAMFDVAGRLFVSGGSVNFSRVNHDEEPAQPCVIVDLPNYAWNHSTKYWHESDASKDWRFRGYGNHDLLGGKILGTTWSAPVWSKSLRLQDLPWLRDHKIGDDIVFPASGYMTMAIEALFQKSQSTGHLDERLLSHEVCYRLRNVRFSRALVLGEQPAEHKMMLSLIPSPGGEDWHRFSVFTHTEGISTEHCRGLIRLGEDSEQVGTEMDLRPLSHSTPARLWYKALREVGKDFGPHFQKQMEIESRSGARHNRSLVSFSPPPSAFLQSSYPIHPACLDGCLQTGEPSAWQGHRSSIDAVLVPIMIDEVIVKSQSTRPEYGIAVASADHIGEGRSEEAANYKWHASVYDSQNKSLLFQISGLRGHKLVIRESPDTSHTYSRLAWKPDISFFSQRQLLGLRNDEQGNPHRQEGHRSLAIVHQIIDMVAHKRPNLKVMEINTLIRSDSIWLDGGVLNSSSRAACRRYHLALSTAGALLDAQGKYETLGDGALSVLDLSSPSLDFKSGEGAFDLIIVKLSSSSKVPLMNMIINVRRFLHDTGYVLFMDYDSTKPDASPDSTLESPTGLADLVRGIGFPDPLQLFFDVEQMLEETGPASVTLATLRIADPSQPDHRISLAHFSDKVDMDGGIKEGLTEWGWQTTDHRLPFTSVEPNSTVLVLDELHSPILSNVSKEQWQALQVLIQQKSKILWVTMGSQLEVTKPENALIHGLARTIRAEDPSLVLVTLDLESGLGTETAATIHRALEYIRNPMPQTRIESEFVERSGIIHISRLLPDNPINNAERHGAETRLQSLHDHRSCVRLVSDGVGTLDSLHYVEVSSGEILLDDGFIEVNIHAASLNFKDVAVAMGIVPADEYRLGLEGAGVIRRVGRDTGSLRVGQRVLVYDKGTFANRVQSPIEAIHPLPDSMSFEEATTLPGVHLVSMYGLIDLAHVQRGQSVLIHSAAGGVGIAAIQLCRYLGAELYVTVGTEEKRKFLIETFGIPSGRIFSSRSTAFAPMLMSATNGKGVNVILNSLTGDMLDASWRCIADHGTFVEIGKKDMLDRNTLSMEPFCRNASYRAVDMSHDSISWATKARLLSQLFLLISEGHVKPIFPQKLFSFGDIVGAFRHMRGGSHIGKIVISDGPDRDVKVPIRPVRSTLRLRADVSYLIVGGLKGICGSLAIFLARHGARHLVILSRSGSNDEKSKATLVQLDALGTHVDLVQGDVANPQDVQEMFRNSTKPIAGIIQGAMVLRDGIFTSMAVTDFHDTLRSKVCGTWNLHNTALEHNLPLDFFTMLSSVSGVVGQRGQANYAAANVFLDSFSAFRRRLGLAACSVDLGVIEDVGYVSENEALAKRFDASIWTPINEGLLHRILRLSILQQMAPIDAESASQMITGIVVPQNEDSFLLRDARFAGLCLGSASTTAANAPDSSRDAQTLLALVKAKAEPSTILSTAVELVNRQLMKILGLNEPMEPTKALSGYGIDSLGAIDLRNWVRVELGKEVTNLEVLGAKTLTSLCENIIAKMTTS